MGEGLGLGWGAGGLSQGGGVNLGQDSGLKWESLAIGVGFQLLEWVSEPGGEVQTQGASTCSGAPRRPYSQAQPR